MSPKVCGKWQQRECVWQVKVSVCVWQVSASECVWGPGEWQGTATIKKEIERTTQAAPLPHPFPPCVACSKLRKLCQPSLIFCCSICCNALLCASHDIFKNSLQNVCFVLRFSLLFSPSSPPLQRFLCLSFCNSFHLSGI